MRRLFFISFVFVLILQECDFVNAFMVPDTGQEKCYDMKGNQIACPLSGDSFYGQDASYKINPKSFTKLDSKGQDLPDSAVSWAMVRDNVTGLIWETKNNKDGIKDYSNPHDADNQYTWYDPTSSYPGIPGDGTDTNDFLTALNSEQFGGYNDWRLPTYHEIKYLLNYGDQFKDNNDETIAINTYYFPDSKTSFYWTSTTDAWISDSARSIQISDGGDFSWSKASTM